MMSNDNNEVKDVITEETEAVEKTEDSESLEETEAVENTPEEVKVEKNGTKREKTSTELLMEESVRAAEKEKEAQERDARNTYLCFQRNMQQFYEYEGLDANQEELDKKALIEKEKEIEAMTFGQEFKYRFNLFKAEMQNPTKKKIRYNQLVMTLISILRAVILFGLCFIIIMPIFEKASYAFRHPLDISNPQVMWIPEKWSTMNISIAYDLLVSDGPTITNSLLLSAITTIIQVIATAVAGYAFARLKFKGSNIIFYLVIASLAFPPEALNISRTLFFGNNSFFGIMLMQNALAIYIMSLFGMGLRSAIFIFLFRQTFRNLPIELEESAEIDGAGVIRTFWSVMLPNAKGTIVTVSLFAFVWQYNDYYWATLFGYKRSMPLVTTALAAAAEMMNSVIGTQYPTLKRELGDVISGEFYELITQTGALIMMLPLLIAYLFIQRLFVESVERSGITGM